MRAIVAVLLLSLLPLSIHVQPDMQENYKEEVVHTKTGGTQAVMSRGDRRVVYDWELSYKPFSHEKAHEYFTSKDVMWANPAHLEIIDRIAEENNVDPLFMISITGAEQSLVKRTSSQYYEVINNPFNVYGSWLKYNTTLEDSAGIACRTISNDRGKSIVEMSKEYAEDHEEWAENTTIYYERIKENIR